MIQISESFLGSNKGCNCVAFRLDDVQDYFLSDTRKKQLLSYLQKKILHLLLESLEV